MTHSQLIARLEQLTGSVDFLTAAGFANDLSPWKPGSENWNLFVKALGDSLEAPGAALSLAEKVLPGWYWLKPNIYLMAMYRPGHGDTESVEHTGYHPVNAIALCIAILKAHGASK